MVQPELLFLDEPFSELDVLTAANLRKQLLDLWRAQQIPTKAILMVTHNIDEAVTMGDRLLVLGTSPGRIRVELPGLPPDERGPHSAARTDLVDLIFRIMTSPHEDVALLLKDRGPGAKTGTPGPPPQPYQTLPHVEIGKVTGLVEAVHARGGRADLHQLQGALRLILDQLLPVVEAADLLGLAYTEKGDLILTEQGRDFAEAGVLGQKELFSERVLANVSLVRFIVQALQTAPNHVVPDEDILSFLQTYFGEEEARAQLHTAIGWGRYAELFSFQEDRGLFRLAEASEPAQPA